MKKYWQLFRKAYYGLIVLIIASSRRVLNEHIPYATVIFIASVLFTFVLLIIIPVAIGKGLLHLFGNKAIEVFDQSMVIYGQTSEYEYRSAETVFGRIADNIPVHEDSSGNQTPEYDLIPYEDIVSDFVSYGGRLYTLRLENKEEFLARRWAEELEQYGPEAKESVCSALEQQFKTITEQGGDDLLKSYYLGREIMAKKIVVGNKKNPKAVSGLKEALQL